MAHSSHRRWHGCAMCKEHKDDTHGDARRTPIAVLRKIGRRKRFSRNRIYNQDD